MVIWESFPLLIISLSRQLQRVLVYSFKSTLPDDHGPLRSWPLSYWAKRNKKKVDAWSIPLRLKKIILTSCLATVCSLILAMKVSRELSFFKDRYFSIIRCASGLKHLLERQCDQVYPGNSTIMSSAFGYWFSKSTL